MKNMRHREPQRCAFENRIIVQTTPTAESNGTEASDKLQWMHRIRLTDCATKDQKGIL